MLYPDLDTTEGVHESVIPYPDFIVQGYIDTGVKIIIGVVVGGVVLGGLYALFNDTVIPTLTTKIGDMFSYAG